MHRSCSWQKTLANESLVMPHSHRTQFDLGDKCRRPGGQRPRLTVSAPKGTLAVRGATELTEGSGKQETAVERSHSAVAAPVRFRHIDSLRAVAALLVVWLHFTQFLKDLVPGDPWLLGFLRAVPAALDMGRLGVIIFFAISGFVICRSFGGPSQGAGKRFVIRRLCRLYPAYWVSMLGGIFWFWLSSQLITWKLLAANTIMIPLFLDQGCLVGVYWTLHVELIFYVLCLCLHRTRWLERPVILAVTVIALTGLSRYWRIIDRTDLGAPIIGRHLYCLGVAVMIWGALFRTVYDQTGGFRRGVRAHRGTWLLLATALALPVVLDPRIGWYLMGLGPGHLPSHIAVAFGMWFFAVWVAWWRVDNRVLTYLGVISYSVYLFHAVVMLIIVQVLKDHPALRAWNLPNWQYCLVGGVLTLGVSAAVYHWVERPAINLGRRWTGSDLTPATASRQSI